jgi:serine/threonine protein kinase
VGRAPECQQLSEAEPLPDLVIPGYRIIRVLGHGGMGMVYEAEQDRPRRRVAIKVINPEIMSRSAMRRFHFEAETLGRLSHPSIARIFAAGTIEPADGSGAYGRDARATTSGGGVLYFVMEFIPHARPITRYADERSLDLDARLELFVHVCDAVHYGHQKGFIHRDLKPANILVGSDSLSPGERAGVRALTDSQPIAHSPQPPEALVKVIDFGIARSTDSDLAITTLHTNPREVIGTLQYMSPEQLDIPDGGSGLASPTGRGVGGEGASRGGSGGGPPSGGDADAVSDIYSLGVVLYELVCGRPPHDLDGKSLPQAARIIAEQDVPPPRTVWRSLQNPRPRGEGRVRVTGDEPPDSDKRRNEGTLTPTLSHPRTWEMEQKPSPQPLYLQLVIERQ